ncbi:hypothetical protein Tco_1036466 [Tanacetum coccineum]
MTKMTNVKENALSVEIQIISSENIQNYQDIKIKKRLLEDLGVIATKMKKRRQITKSVLWLKIPMRTHKGFPKNPHHKLATFEDFESDSLEGLRISTVFTNEWDLACLEYSQETEGPYCTNLLTPDDIRQLLELERVMVDHIIKIQTVSLNPNQILTKELSLDMKQWDELIRENVFGLGGNRDRLPVCLAHMLYYVVVEEQYNLAYFFVKRIECVRATPTVNLLHASSCPKTNLTLLSESSISSSCSHHQGTSSHQRDDDDDDVETSRASTPSPTTYLNSLNPLNY